MKKTDSTKGTDGAETPLGSADAANGEGRNVSRRDMVKSAWAAPVFVAVNLPKGVFAQSAISPVATPAGTSAPTGAPALAPVAPTGAPTGAPTSAPTSAPTPA